MEEQSVTSDSSSACEFPSPIPAAYTSITATYSVIQRQYMLETQAYIGYGIKIVPSENIAPFEIEDITTSEFFKKKTLSQLYLLPLCASSI